jgi:hypothetical protein
METYKDAFKKINPKVLVVCLILIIIIIILLFVMYNPWQNNDSLRIILLSVLSNILSLVVAFCLWEMVAKRSFSQDILSLASISSNIALSGIDHIYEDFNSTDWGTLISNCKKKFTIAFTYGRTWREHNRESLQAFVNRGGELEFFLPDYRNAELMHVLDTRFKYNTGRTKEYIEESITRLNEIGARVYLYNGIFQTSYYILDDISLLSVYNHSNKKGYVPAFKISRDGTLHRYITSEIQSIRENSIEYSEIAPN